MTFLLADEVVLKTVAAPRRAAKKTYGREQVTKISTKDVPAKSEEEKAEFQIKAVLKSLKDELRYSNYNVILQTSLAVFLSLFLS